MTDFELLSALISLQAPVYLGLWKLLSTSQKNRDDIGYINNQMSKLAGCKYCKKGIDEV